MSNVFYNHTDGVPVSQSRGSSSAIRAEFDLIQAAFNMLPTQVQMFSDSALIGVDSGSASTYVVAGPASITSLSEGMAIEFKALNTCNASAKIQFNGLAAANIVRPDGSAILPGDIQAGMYARFRYTSGNFQHTNGANAAASASATAAANSATAASNSASQAATSASSASSSAASASASASSASNSAALLSGVEVSLASAATVNIGAANSTNVIITGTTTITAFDNVADGIKRDVTFAGALTLTNNNTSLILPGAANITTSNGDCATLLSLGSGNWRCIKYQYAGAAPVIASSINGHAISGMLNRLINGAFQESNYNGTSAVTPAVGNAYVIDRWTVAQSVVSTFTFQQVTDAPTGHKYSLKISVAAQRTPAAADAYNLQQKIEGLNVIDLAFGTSGALQVTLSEQIKGSVAGTYGVSLANSAGDRSIVGTIAVTNSWAPITVTFPGCMDGTWLTDTGIGLVLKFDLGCGSNFNTTTTGAWQVGNFQRTTGCVTFANQVVGSTLNITGVQLEAGSVATPFIRDDESELKRKCKRYLPSYISSSANEPVCDAKALTTTTAHIVFPFDVEPRVPPTGITSAGTLYLTNSAGTSAGNLTALTFNIASKKSALLNATIAAANLTAGNASTLLANSTSTQINFTGCEL